jgi:hypothetical protein
MDKSDPTDKFPSMLKVVEQTYKAGQTTYMVSGSCLHHRCMTNVT